MTVEQLRQYVCDRIRMNECLTNRAKLSGDEGEHRLAKVAKVRVQVLRDVLEVLGKANSEWAEPSVVGERLGDRVSQLERVGQVMRATREQGLTTLNERQDMDHQRLLVLEEAVQDAVARATGKAVELASTVARLEAKVEELSRRYAVLRAG